jgi:pyruvate/2-oxoglutarate dehydrogenase complex dihydrolipoamide acyltransferase (E2) component
MAARLARTIAERPMVRSGEIATAHLMPLNLARDHRIH